METRSAKRRREEKERQEKEDDSDACCPRVGVDTEREGRPKKARKEQEVGICEEQDVISQLPGPLQDQVFGLLGVRDKVEAAQVCSSWRGVGYRPCQWKDVKMRLDLEVASEKELSSFKQRKIRHLRVDNLLVNPSVVDMFQDCLVSLDLSHEPLPFVVLEKVFCKGFSSLRNLQVNVQNTELLDFPRVEKVFQQLCNLEDLGFSLSKCDSGTVEAVTRNLKNLKQLSLNAFPKGAFSLEFLGHLSGLQSLSLAFAKLSGIDCLESSGKSLKKVCVRHCHFDTARWPEILSQMSPLEELKLLYCTPVLYEGLMQLVQGQKNLKVLRYNSVSESYFDLKSLAGMHSLENLHLSRCWFKIGDDLRTLSRSLENLRSLVISGCKNLSSAFVECIAGLPSLQSLSLEDMMEVDGSTLKMISRGSCQLRKLHLRDCFGIHGEAMRHIAAMSSLRDLSLVKAALGSTEINCLKEGTFRLEALSIVDCETTFEDVEPWLEKLQPLQQLILCGLEMTTAEKMKAEGLGKVFILKEWEDFEVDNDGEAEDDFDEEEEEDDEEDEDDDDYYRHLYGEEEDDDDEEEEEEDEDYDNYEFPFEEDGEGEDEELF